MLSSFTDTLPTGALWDREASYKYYLHGPLARTEIGHYRVQGMDYAYTLQGWIKGLNASFLNTGKDMGKDANNVAGHPNRYAAADAFGYTLGFYNAPNSQSGIININDYDPIGGSTNRFEVNYTSSGTPVPFHTDGFSQYTGNIRFIAQQTQGISYGANVQAYRYDQLMRLNSMNTYKPDATALTNWNITTSTGQAPLQSNYKEGSINYDRNGNILSYQRWGASTGLIQDNLTYSYIAGTNKLSHVTDASTSATTGEVTTQATNNYTYDGAGNLITDAQGNSSITWSPYGKVLQVYRSLFASNTYFGYDAMQNRVKKRQASLSSDISTFYIRDAQGNVLAVYEKNGTTVTWKEQHLYGSSRLGTVEPGVAWTTTPAATPHFRSTRILNYGWKRYEINDHLGNVRALINDRKTYGGATFAATLLDATDYFPFGAEMRKGTVMNSYRYGFNGKELDKNNEFGSLNHYDYGFRIYNPGIGRFLSVDPLTKKYPELTPYQFASNTPIWAIDLDGLEAYFTNMGVFSHFGKDKSLTAPVILISESKEIKIQLNYTQLLDRAHWVFGEGRGNFADHYAHTIQNGKEWGYHGEGFTESKLFSVFMQDNERKGKEDFFSGHAGVSTYDDFTAVRSNPSGLNKLKGASTSIQAVLNEQAGLTEDPTFGATNWAGDGPKSDNAENYAKRRVGADLVLALTSPDRRTHIFYDLRSQKDLDRLGILRPSRKSTPFFKIDSSFLKMPQFDKLPMRPMHPLDYVKSLKKDPKP